MIIYNGATGGLGRYLQPVAASAGTAAVALRARLEDETALTRELDEITPEGHVTFMHFAALVSVPACEADPDRAYATNVSSALRVLQRVIDWSARRDAELRVIYVSTGHVYAARRDGDRLREDAPVLPRSVYARTKLEAEQRLGALALSNDIPLIVARVFGLLAPHQSRNYLLPALIERVRRGDVEQIPGLDYVRDYLDARDVCRSLAILSSDGVVWHDRIINVCSGAATSVRDVLRLVATAMNPTEATDVLERATPADGRPDDIPWLVGDPSRVIAWTGQEPQRIPLAQTVHDALESYAG